VVLFKSLGVLSYSTSIVMALFCIICEISRPVGRKSQLFNIHLYLAPSVGLPSRNFAKVFNNHKTRMTRLLCGEETMTMAYVKPLP